MRIPTRDQRWCKEGKHYVHKDQIYKKKICRECRKKYPMIHEGTVRKGGINPGPKGPRPPPPPAQKPKGE